MSRGFLFYRCCNKNRLSRHIVPHTYRFAITLMFSDAARTIVAARGDCQYNIDGNQLVADEFCSDQLLAVIIRMYSVLVGDVALEYFQSSDAMVAVFVFFSFFSIIIRESRVYISCLLYLHCFTSYLPQLTYLISIFSLSPEHTCCYYY